MPPNLVPITKNIVENLECRLRCALGLQYWRLRRGSTEGQVPSGFRLLRAFFARIYLSVYPEFTSDYETDEDKINGAEDAFS